MIIVNGIIESTAEDIAAVKDALAVMERESRAENGCHDYTFSVEVNNPNTLRITEKWDDMEALKAHFGSSHMAQFRQAMGAHPPKSSTVSFFEAAEVDPPR